MGKRYLYHNHYMKTKLTKSQLKEAVKGVVRECLMERVKHVKEDVETAEVSPEVTPEPAPTEAPVGHGYSEQDEIKLIKVLAHVAEILMDMHKGMPSADAAPAPFPADNGGEAEENPETPEAPETDNGLDDEEPAVDEGDEADSMDDQDQELQANSDFEHSEKQRAAKDKSKKKKKKQDDAINENEDPEIETGEEHGEEAVYFGGQGEEPTEEPTEEPSQEPEPQGIEQGEDEEVRLLKAIVLISKKLQKMHGAGMDENYKVQKRSYRTIEDDCGGPATERDPEIPVV